MINCNYPNCKHLNNCELKLPITKSYSKLLKELYFELNYLRELNKRKKYYFKVLDEIKNSEYSNVIYIAGRQITVPKINAKNEYIIKPENIIVDLNYKAISQEIEDTKNIVRELRKKEHNIIKILKKRVDKYDKNI